MQRRAFLRTGGIAAASIGGVGLLTGSATAAGVPMVSTRDHFDDDGKLTAGHTPYDYEADDIFGSLADDDMTLMVHGWRSSPDEAVEKAEKADAVLTGQGYDGTVVGYSWDSDKGGGVDQGWGEAKTIAHKNGKKLANVLNYIKESNGSDLHLVTHSLGVQVALYALMNLRNWDGWQDNDRRLQSVHFLGAAQHDESVTPEWGYHRYNGIRYETGVTYNYHSRDDDVLEWIFKTWEVGAALGEIGADSPTPDNYWDVDVTTYVGDDHRAYLDSVGGIVEYHMDNSH